MSHAVVVVGPTALRGPHDVDADIASIALTGIDEDLVLIDERIVPTEQVWHDLFEAVLGGRFAAATLIVPSWWPSSRVVRITTAAGLESTNIVVRQRVDAWPVEATVIEVAPELVVVHTDARRHAIARTGSPSAVVAAVVACVQGLSAVTVDVPAGLTTFGAEVSLALRRGGVAVTIVDDRALERAVHLQPLVGIEPRRRSRWRAVSPRAASIVGAVLMVGALGAAGVTLDGGSARTVEDGTWLVEGRVAVEVPAHWTVERITSGPGSARVEVLSSSDRWAIQVTQSQVPTGQTLSATAEALRLALAEEPAGVFIEFTAGGRRAERPVVSYREIRADHHVEWAVMLDRGVRIAIGCQGAPDDVGPVQSCDRAIRSAHAVS